MERGRKRRFCSLASRSSHGFPRHLSRGCAKICSHWFKMFLTHLRLKWKIASYFTEHPSEVIGAGELAHRLNRRAADVAEVLLKMHDKGLLVAEQPADEVLFSLNPDHPAVAGMVRKEVATDRGNSVSKLEEGDDFMKKSTKCAKCNSSEVYVCKGYANQRLESSMGDFATYVCLDCGFMENWLRDLSPKNKERIQKHWTKAAEYVELE